MNHQLKQELKQEIKETLKTAIRRFFERKQKKLPIKNATSQTSNILDILFPKERRIRLLIGGLETSMGTVWEAIAVKLAQNNGFSIISDKILMPSPFPEELAKTLENLISTRINRKTFISTEDCITQLKEVAQKIDSDRITFVKPPSGHGVDLYLKKNNTEYLFDLKSPQPNKGDFPRYTRQLLEWYAYKLAQNPSLQLEARIAFIFNPFDKSWYEEQKYKISTCLDINRDIYVENEFWDFCSGQQNTWQALETLFYELKAENFDQEFEDIFYQSTTE
ncbi:TdeIII family type II restriction endonuclease [Planktothricoides raciborskii]|uniref:type II site-specific deoxyribonuclease n=1 Tax=Planktothricoides raciborskii GIHE-MW2 TaxID=2792601 RepID=A0AAU8JDH6_9CYAN